MHENMIIMSKMTNGPDNFLNSKRKKKKKKIEISSRCQFMLIWESRVYLKQ